MYAQKVLVTFADGTSKDVVLTQWSIGQFAQWAARQKLDVDLSSPGLMGVVMLRFQAFAELHRDPTTPKVQFEKWDLTVSEVEPEEDDDGAVDPIQPDPSDT